MKKLLLILLVMPITACEGLSITKDDIDVAEYVCAKTGEDLHDIEFAPIGMRIRCGGVEGDWVYMNDAIRQHGTTCILDSK